MFWFAFLSVYFGYGRSKSCKSTLVCFKFQRRGRKGFLLKNEIKKVHRLGAQTPSSCLDWSSHCLLWLVSMCTSIGSMTLHLCIKLEKSCCLWWWSSRFAEVLISLLAWVLLLNSLNCRIQWATWLLCAWLGLFYEGIKTRGWIKTTKPLKSYSVSSVKISGFVVQACLMLHIFSVMRVASLHNN